MCEKLTDDRYAGMYVKERDTCLKSFMYTLNRCKNRKLIKCAVCGDIDYVSADEPTVKFSKIENSDKYVCSQCLSGDILSHEEALALDRSLGIDDDADDNTRYRDPGRVMPHRFLYSFDESKRYSKQSTLLLKDFLLENDKETYDNYKDLIEEAIANNARFDV